MLLTRGLPLALILACPALAQEASPAPIESSTPPGTRGSVEVIIGLYQNDDHGDGNPFLDEQETVIEPVIVFDLNVTDTVGVTATLSYDFVSSASIDRLSRYPEQSGASGDYYFGGDVALRWRATDDLRLSIHGGYSIEYDYNSAGFGANAALDLFEKNTTLSLGLNGFVDTVRVIRFDGSENEGDEDRTSLTVNLGWYQVLSPTVHMELGYSFTHQSGFLETAFNSVVLEDPSDPPNPNLENNARGVEVAEELDDSRIRHAIHGEVRKYFDTGTSLALWGRFYADSWGIVSQTVELRLYQWIVPDVLRARLRYRYYRQSAADDFDDHFRIPPAQRAAFVLSQERTQDADLGEFDSHGVGLQFTWTIRPGHELTLGADYVLRSDGIDQVVGMIGYKLGF